MELKLRCERYVGERNLVLIVPLWNWNVKSYVTNDSRLERSNRTFMELKCEVFDMMTTGESRF